MIIGKTHFKRKISEDDFQKVREIQNEFKKSAQINHWSIIDLSTTDNIIEIVKKLLPEKGKL